MFSMDALTYLVLQNIAHCLLHVTVCAGKKLVLPLYHVHTYQVQQYSSFYKKCSFRAIKPVFRSSISFQLGDGAAAWVRCGRDVFFSSCALDGFHRKNTTIIHYDAA